MSSVSDYKSRKGAASPAKVPPEILKLLNRGELECVNLSEWLAIDGIVLLGHVNRTLGLGIDPEVLRRNPDNAKAMTLHRSIAGLLLDAGLEESRRSALSAHASDTVRGWAALMAGQEKTSPEMKLEQLLPFAADMSMTVRELAWMALRPDIVEDPEGWIERLTPLAHHGDANVRRFTSEATRPRGVWSAHVPRLKETPSLGRGILEPLKNDPVRYVQDSVANWLNDASKSDPEWVVSLCRRWEKESPSGATAYIVKRALRTVSKALS